MHTLRIYGEKPYKVVVVHGGPGALGEMAPVARMLAADYGVLEPLQTAATLAGQIEELRKVLERQGDFPVVLIGFSWGAWLSFLLTAKYPALVRKLILVSSGPFNEGYAQQVQDIRLKRLGPEGQKEYIKLLNHYERSILSEDDFVRLGSLCAQADAYDSLPQDMSDVVYRADIFQKVWPEGAACRRSGELIQQADQIHCPVSAIHGAEDSHPPEGVKNPLGLKLKDFRFFELPCCGHRPWAERKARDHFYKVLFDEVS